MASSTAEGKLLYSQMAQLRLSPEERQPSYTAPAPKTPPSFASHLSPVAAESLLEQLPIEIKWQILDYVPESAIKVMQTSRTMYSCVRGYAAEDRNIQLVELLLIIYSHGLNLHMEIPGSKSELFELRLKVLNPSSGVRTQIHKKYPKQKLHHSNSIIRYEVGCASRTHFNDVLTFVRKLIGTRIGTLHPGYERPGEVDVTSKLLEGKQITGLQLDTYFLEQCDMEYILRVVRNHSANDCALSVSKIADGLDPSSLFKFLRELASFVSSLHLRQCGSSRNDHEAKYFWGIRDARWAPVIMEMFSKNKLMTMTIRNEEHPYFLRKECADSLIQQLPLLKKKIRLSVDCMHFQIGRISYNNGCTIDVIREKEGYGIHRFTRYVPTLRINNDF